MTTAEMLRPLSSDHPVWQSERLNVDIGVFNSAVAQHAAARQDPEATAAIIAENSVESDADCVMETVAKAISDQVKWLVDGIKLADTRRKLMERMASERAAKLADLSKRLSERVASLHEKLKASGLPTACLNIAADPVASSLEGEAMGISTAAGVDPEIGDRDGWETPRAAFAKALKALVLSRIVGGV